VFSDVSCLEFMIAFTSALLSDGWCLEFMVASHFSIIVRCLECRTFTFHVCLIYHCSLKLD
jgi:hypothetical protein